MTTIAERLQAVQASIHKAVTNAGRLTEHIALIAVSKAQPAANIRTAFNQGQRLFGENYLQEALDKQAQLSDLNIEWHFIGPIQSNKTQQTAQHFAWVHGIDRLKIAQRLNDARPDHLPPLQVCIQVNVSEEESKSGVPTHEVESLVSAIKNLPRLKLRGLMAIPAPTTDIALQHQQFAIVRTLYQQLNAEGYRLDTLSMGMSDDFAIAIAEGATMIRIGTAIFGARQAKSSNE
ncbi:MAG TPA: YggS family pyridoxal phosphate-dependent enzyme [Methylophilaceae bacterium]|nr:YggS family pyridoxal phosphate-dependent enzyme [Methylophilaceae bacterium]